MGAQGAASGLYYELIDEAGADAPVVVLSPGLGGSAAYWTPQLPALTPHFRVLLYDHRGTGRSVRALPEPYSVEALGDDIALLLDALGIERAHVVGHAAGGHAALSLALRRPDRVRRVVDVNGWSRPDPHIARCFEARLALLNHVGAKAYVRAQPLFLYPAAWISQNTALLDREAEHQLAAFPTKAIVRARIQAVLNFDIDARLPDITAPVLVAAAADDMLVPSTCSERLAARLPNAVLDRVAWGGHAFTVTAPERFNRVLVAFLRGEPLPAQDP